VAERTNQPEDRIGEHAFDPRPPDVPWLGTRARLRRLGRSNQRLLALRLVDRNRVEEGVHLEPDHGHDTEEVEIDHEHEEEAERLAIGRTATGQPQVEGKDERQTFEENASEGGSDPHLPPVLAAVRHHVVDGQEEQEAGADAEHRSTGRGAWS